jgi:F-type H+-transporting ATPase subunit b
MPESTHSPCSAQRTSPRAASFARALLVMAALAAGAGVPGIALAQHDHGDGHGHDHGDGHGQGHGDGHAADPSAHFNWFDLGYASKDVYGGTLEDGEEPMSPPFIMMIFNFAVVLTILNWKVRPAIRRYTSRRHETIKSALEEAGRLREQARAKLDEYTAQLARAEKEIEQMVTDIRQGAEAEKQRILADAQAQAQAMKRDAEQRIAAEIERARMELEREVVAAAITAAERLIREQASKSDFTQLADGFIQDIQSQADARPGAHS